MVVAPLVAAPLGNEFGWPAPFFLFGTIGLILPFFWPEIGQAAKPTVFREERTPRLVAILRIGDMTIISLISFGVTFTNSFNVFVPTYLVDHFGLGLVQAGFVSAIAPFIGFLSVIGGGAVSDWVDRFSLLRILLIVSGILFALLYCWTDRLIPFIILFGLTGITRGMLISTSLAVSNDVITTSLEKQRATAFAYFNTLAFAGAGIGPALIGYVLDKTTLGYVFLSFVFIYILCLLLSYVLGRTTSSATGPA
jgi:MFS family permease